MHIFVIHYTPLVQRKKHMLEQFQKQNIVDYEFVEIYDKERIPPLLSQMFSPKLRDSLVSLICKHLHAFKQIALNHEYALILEDDAILCDNFFSQLDLFMKQLPDDFDAFFIGRGCNLFVPQSVQQPGKYVYLKRNESGHWNVGGSSRCTEAFILSSKAATRLVNTVFENVEMPCDFLLNELFRKHNMKVYWAEPTLVIQGTMSGMFPTSLS
jgi:GR25 family glycosyltransferase involved in LPS biosynthesis